MSLASIPLLVSTVSERNSATPIGEKFLPAFFVDVIEKDYSFDRGEWPAHITLFPPIEQPYVETYAHTLRRHMNPIHPFEIIVGEDAWFGEAGDVPVKRIIDSPELQRVHTELVRVCGILLHDPTYRQPYRPHISYPDEFGITSGQRIAVGGFCLTVKDGGVWRVEDKVGFKGRA